MTKWSAELQRLSPEQLQSLMKLGSSVGKVIDLKDKVAKTQIEGAAVVSSGSSSRAEAHAALTTLGITAKQSEAILNKLLKQNPNAPTEELVRNALQLL